MTMFVPLVKDLGPVEGSPVHPAIADEVNTLTSRASSPGRWKDEGTHLGMELLPRHIVAAITANLGPDRNRRPEGPARIKCLL